MSFIRNTALQDISSSSANLHQTNLGCCLEMHLATVYLWLYGIRQIERKGNVLFNDTLNTLFSYTGSDVVDDLLGSRRSNPLPPHGLFFPITSKGSFIGTSERERNVLFNDTLNTFYLWLYGVRHMVKDHSDSEKGNPLLPHRLLLSINSKGSFICTIPQTG